MIKDELQAGRSPMQQGALRRIGHQCGGYTALLRAISALSIVLASVSSSAQWVQTNGPVGGSINCFAVSGTGLFVGLGLGGIYRSVDDGENWTPANTGLPGSWISDLAVSGTDLYTATLGGEGIFRSIDNGLSWNAVNTGLTDFNTISLAVIGSDIFVGTGSSGVFRTTDNGSNWTQVNSGLTNMTVASLSATGSTLYLSLIHI